MTRPPEVLAIRSLVDVAEVFLQLARSLGSTAGVTRVTSPIYMRAEEKVDQDSFKVGHGPGLRLEWYAEGEFEDGRGISFAQELSWHEGSWLIEASVRASDELGEHILREFAARRAVDAVSLTVRLREQAEQLLAQGSENLERFLRHSY
jgi:hypothetical protein